MTKGKIMLATYIVVLAFGVTATVLSNPKKKD